MTEAVPGALVNYRSPTLALAIKTKIVAVSDDSLRISIDGLERDVDPAHCQPILLRNSLPHEFMSGEYRDTAAYALRNAPVVLEVSLCYRASWKPWPGRERNVQFWVALANGKAVGFNENPSRGWSFPVITLKKDRTR